MNDAIIRSGINLEEDAFFQKVPSDILRIENEKYRSKKHGHCFARLFAISREFPHLGQWRENLGIVLSERPLAPHGPRIPAGCHGVFSLARERGEEPSIAAAASHRLLSKRARREGARKQDDPKKVRSNLLSLPLPRRSWACR